MKPSLVEGIAIMVGIVAVTAIGVYQAFGPSPSSANASGPPWVYGRADAAFRITEYADLECPFCKTYFPVLKQWIDQHPEVQLQWHHLPLPFHEPAASAEAHLVECAGQVAGPEAFWNAVEWVYTNTRTNGQGLPPDAVYSGLSMTQKARGQLQQCLQAPAPERIAAQRAEAAAQRIQATPMLRIENLKSGKTLMLAGAVEGDTLLSAIDYVASSDPDTDSTASDESLAANNPDNQGKSP
jgi:protein-disulfide isomerase